MLFFNLYLTLIPILNYLIPQRATSPTMWSYDLPSTPSKLPSPRKLLGHPRPLHIPHAATERRKKEASSCRTNATTPHCASAPAAAAPTTSARWAHPIPSTSPCLPPPAPQSARATPTAHERCERTTARQTLLLWVHGAVVQGRGRGTPAEARRRLRVRRPGVLGAHHQVLRLPAADDGRQDPRLRCRWPC